MQRHTADTAWVVLAAGVITYEIAAPSGELLSEGVDRYLTQRPWVTRTVVGILAAHLLNLLPARLDPLHQISTLFDR